MKTTPAPVRVFVCQLLLGIVANQAVAASPSTLRTEANVPVELTFTALRPQADPFNAVTLDVVFVDPQRRELRVPAFWAGSNLWKARYASPVPGTHRFRSECSDPHDQGLHGATGKVEVKPYTGQHPLYRHGPLRAATNRRFLEHADGTPFFWLGDTWWMGLCHRLRWPDEFQQLTADRKEKGFNVIQIVAGLYPDMFPFDPRGANETGFPWQTNYTSIRPEYFDAADQRLAYLVEQGFTPCVVGAWGYFLPWLGAEKMKQHWRYLIARYGAWPVVWCAAGEANLPWYLVDKFPFDDREQARAWSDVMRYIRATDPFHRLLTVHPTGLKRLSARHVADDPGLLDFDLLQTPHGRRSAVPETISNVRQSYSDQPTLPVINGEATYEMLEENGNPIPTEWVRRMFWLCMMNGAAGHTYGANGIWQLNRKDQPHGPSPTAGSPPNGYGAIPWDEAMRLPGSQQAGLGRKFLEQFRWTELQPHPEWASFIRQPSLKFDGCQWIWFPEGKPATNAPEARRFFRRTFVVPEGKSVELAQLRIAADDQFTARLNGEFVGASPRSEKDTWKIGRQYDNLAAWVRPGTNVLAVDAENQPTAKPNTPNPAGLIARLEIHFRDRTAMEVVTDGNWTCGTNRFDGWTANPLEAAGWTKVAVIAAYGDKPWKRFDPLNNDDVFGPQSAGIPGVMRIIYVPESDPVLVNHLESGVTYQARYFDPITGDNSAVGSIRPDGSGRWKCVPPPDCHHDWVLVLEAQR